MLYLCWMSELSRSSIREGIPQLSRLLGKSFGLEPCRYATWLR